MFCCLNDTTEKHSKENNEDLLKIQKNWTKQWASAAFESENLSFPNKILPKNFVRNTHENKREGRMEQQQLIALPKYMTVNMSEEKLSEGTFVVGGYNTKKQYHQNLKRMKANIIRTYNNGSPHYLDVRELINNDKAFIKKDETIYYNSESLVSPLTTHESIFDELYDVSSNNIDVVISDEKDESVRYIASPITNPLYINTVLDTNDDSSNIRPIDCREIFSRTSPSFLPHAYRGEFYENLHKRF